MATQKLYNTLVNRGLYTKSFDAFKQQFNDQKYREKVYNTVTRDGLYTKDLNEFQTQYAPDNVKDEVGTIQNLVGALGEGFAGQIGGGLSDLTVGLALNTKMFWEKNFGDGDVSEDDKARFRREAYLENKDNILLNPDFWKGAEDYFRSIQKEYEDPTISEAFTKASSISDYLELGERTVAGIFKSAPSLLAAYSGPGALAVYGTSLAGDKYLEEFDKDPTQANSRLLASAIGTSAIEVGFEFATRGLMKQAGLVAKQGNKEAAEAIIKGGTKTMFQKFGKPLAQEGASEAATELTSLIYDAAILNPDGVSGIDWAKEKYRLFDAGIVGSAMGGTIGSLGNISNRNERRRLEQILMPDEVKQQIESSGARISKLVRESDGADADTKSLIEDQINKENRNIVKLKNEVSTKLNNMNETELRTYAKNKNEIAKVQMQLKKLDANSEVYKPVKSKYDLLIKQNSTLYNNATKRRLQEDVTSVKKLAKKQGIKKVSVLDDKGFQDAYKNTEEGSKLNDKQLALQASGVSGFYDKATNSIFINKNAAENYGQVTVASHELLHPVLNKVFGSGESQAAKVADFKSILSSKQRRLMDQEMTNRGYTKQEEATEYFNVFLDAVADNKSEIAFEKNLFTRIGEFLKSIFGEYNINNMDFGDANGVFNFLKAYQESVKQGEFTQEVSDIIGDLSDLQDLDATGKQDSRNASDQVQQIYQQQGAAGAFDIIELFKPITNKIVEKRRGAPNFDKTLLTEEIETGERGIIDLINEYDPESGVPLAAYINKFLPARAIEASRRILGEEFTTDIDEARDVAAEEVTEPEVTTQPQARKIKPIDLVSDPKIKEEYINDVKNKTKDLDPSKLTFKKLKDLSSDITAKIFNVPAKKITDATANLTKQEKENALKFIRANALDLISLLPEGAITEAATEKLLGTSTGVPKSLLNKFYTKQSRIKKGAGLSPFTKNPNITRKQFLEAFGIVDGKKSTDFGPRTPEAQAVKAMMSLYGKLATNTVVRQELALQEEVDQRLIEDLAAGKSQVQFSKANRELLEELNIEGYYEIKDKAGIDKYIQDISLLREIFGDEFLESGKTPGTLSAEIYTGLNVNIKDKSLREYFRAQVKQINFEPIGTKKYAAPRFSSLFSKNKVLNGSTIQNNLSKVKEFNQQVTKNFDYMWDKCYDAIKKDPKNAVVILAYLQNSVNSVTHPHRNGATFDGYDPNAESVHLEHTLQQIRAARILVKAAVESNNKQEFIDKLNKVKENYKLLAISKLDNTKLDKTKYKDENGKLVSYKDGMGVDWDYLSDSWIKRYFNKEVLQQQGGINPDNIIMANGQTATEVYKVDAGGNVLSDESIEIREEARKLNDDFFKILVGGKSVEQQTQTLKTYDRALNFSRVPRPEKGISIFDFDQTLANTKEKVIVNMPDGTSTKIDAAEFAREAEQLESNGAEFDFTEFNKVKGATKGPFFELAQKIKGKFGNKDIFILTARPQNAAPAIQKFLKGVGLDIRIENITGLEDGSPQAKAKFVSEKVTEGYNNFFFGDDAYKNVEAVQEVLNVADVKNDVQQAKIQFSKNLNKRFNEIISENKGIDPDARFSEAAAKVRGAKADKFWSRLFVPPSAEDFKGLLYMLVGKGKKGESQMQFFEDALIKPFARAFRDINAAKQKIANEYAQLKKDLPNVKRNLLQATDYNNFTFDQAIRVYLMNKNNIDIPGIAKRDTDALVKIVKSDPELMQYADRVSQIMNKQEGYIVPTDVSWLSSTVEQDLKDLNNKVNRSDYLAEWVNNKNEIFTEDNLNKLEALYGRSYREALEDILYRMEIGSNRPAGQNKLVNDFTSWINNAVGNIMFLNVRSALLQTISFANFVNWSDNNPIKYMATVANFPQFAKDFAMIWNSDFLKNRRAGLQTDVSASEIVNQAANSKNKVSAILSYILGKGYLPTQMGDSFAICMGGAGFYRNRVSSYVKQGLNQAEAETRAFADMQETSEDAQQSARPDKISQQQAGPLGRFILAFQNTPMQYTRMIKKAALDLANGRGDAKTNISKILYYGAIQNFIFSALQSALFALAFSDEEEEKEKQRYSRIANSMADTILRGTGVYGAAASTLKNIALQFVKQEKKGSRADHAYTIIEGVNLSPPIGSKIRKLYSATQAVKFNRDEIAEMGFDIDNPAYDAVANTVSAVTNVPLDRAVRITDNARAALDKNNEAWQRVALVLGWNTWDLGIQPNKQNTGKKRKNKKREISLY